jgi:hypothetical protein
MGRGKVSTQPIFSHLQGIDMSYRFKETGGQGTKVCINSSSHRFGLVGHYLSSCSGRGSGVIWRVVHPEAGLLLGVVSVPCHKYVMISPVLA